MRFVRMILMLLVLAFGLFFGLLNAGDVDLNYYLGTRTVPLSLVIVVSLIAGAVLGSLASLGILLRQRRKFGRLRHEVGRLDGGSQALQKIS